MWLQSKRQFQPEQGKRSDRGGDGRPGNGAISSTYSKSCYTHSSHAAGGTHTTQTATICRASNNPTCRLLMFCPSPSMSTSLTGSFNFPTVGDKFSLHRQENVARGIGQFIAILSLAEIFFPLHCRRFWVVSPTEFRSSEKGKEGPKCHTEVKTSLNFNRHRRWANNKNIFGVQSTVIPHLPAAVNWQQLPLPFPHSQHSPPWSPPHRTLSIWQKCERC